MIFGDTYYKVFIFLPDTPALPASSPALPASLTYPLPLSAPRRAVNSQLWSLQGTVPAVPSLWSSQPPGVCTWAPLSSVRYQLLGDFPNPTEVTHTPPPLVRELAGLTNHLVRLW